MFFFKVPLWLNRFTVGLTLIWIPFSVFRVAKFEKITRYMEFCETMCSVLVKTVKVDIEPENNNSQDLKFRFKFDINVYPYRWFSTTALIYTYHNRGDTATLWKQYCESTIGNIIDNNFPISSTICHCKVSQNPFKYDFLTLSYFYTRVVISTRVSWSL